MAKEMLHTISDMFDMKVSREASLLHHLTVNFYPPIPAPIKEAFVACFRDYWNGGTGIEDLELRLWNDAGYKGGLHRYDMDQFLDEEDLQETIP